MAFRVEATIGAILTFCSMGLARAAEPVEGEVRHQHWKGGEMGTLSFSESSVAFEEAGKHSKHSQRWEYNDIQQLSVSGERIRILTYDDQRWKLGRDREYVFDELPEGLARKVYAMLHARLDQRFVAELADSPAPPLWSAKAKLLHRFSGAQGTVSVTGDGMKFETDAVEQSREWRIQDIENVSSSGPFDLSITTYERSRWGHGEPTEFRFQLKERLSPERYQELWRRVNKAKGLRIITSQES